MRLHALVTGGAGYIGSHTCKALAAAGYTPVVIDNLSTGHPEISGWRVIWFVSKAQYSGEPTTFCNSANETLGGKLFSPRGVSY